MEQWLIDNGYSALFLLSFLAATFLPLGSELLLVALLINRFDPMLSIVIATAGNTLGAMTTYVLGFWGGPYVLQRLLQINEVDLQKAEHIYARYGCWSLLFTWLPIVGDPLCLVGGVLQVSWTRFLGLVTIGKLARYLVVAMSAIHIENLFF